MSDDFFVLIILFLAIGNLKIRIKDFEFKFEGIIYKLILGFIG
ncbi:hypothetical protein [uncultured Clostridium sp.]|nr:hypothetical protein [uncultured Clostridium sp.]